VQRKRITLYVLFLAAYGMVLSGYLRKSRLAIHGHFANRVNPEVQNVIGFFANTHLLGIDLNGNPTGLDILDQVRDTIWNALCHQEMPIYHLWNTLKCYPRYEDARLLLDCVVRRSSDHRSVLPDGLIVEPAPLPESGFPRWPNLGIYVDSEWGSISLLARFSVDHFACPWRIPKLVVRSSMSRQIPI
jgi:hypothetical protein